MIGYAIWDYGFSLLNRHMELNSELRSEYLPWVVFSRRMNRESAWPIFRTSLCIGINWLNVERIAYHVEWRTKSTSIFGVEVTSSVHYFTLWINDDNDATLFRLFHPECALDVMKNDHNL